MLFCDAIETVNNRIGQRGKLTNSPNAPKCDKFIFGWISISNNTTSHHSVSWKKLHRTI